MTARSNGTKRSSLFEVLLAAGFLDLGSLALQTAQIIQLCTAHSTLTDDLDMINAGAVQRERALYADAVAHAANRKGFAAGKRKNC